MDFPSPMLSDLRLAVRTLARSPGFTVVAVLMLALGVGASTACFSFLNAFFLRPPPFERPQELVSLHVVDERTPGLMALSFPNFRIIVRKTPCSPTSHSTRFSSVRFTEGEKKLRSLWAVGHGSYFDLLGVKAVLGRTLTTADDREDAPPVVVVSHAFWLSRLGANAGRARPHGALQRSALHGGRGGAGQLSGGQCIRIDRLLGLPASVYRSVMNGPALDSSSSRRAVMVPVIGRLKPGVTLQQAEAALKPVSEGLCRHVSRGQRGRSIRLVPIAQANAQSQHARRSAARWQPAHCVVGLILLIACANLANLLLARAGARSASWPCGWPSAPAAARS